MVSFTLEAAAALIYNLFVYNVFGDAIVASLFGLLVLTIISVKMGLGADSIVVLVMFIATMFTQSMFFNFDLGIMVLIAISVSVVVMGMMKLMK